MMRYFTALLLPATFLVLTPAPADAQRPAQRRAQDALPGTYVNMNNGGNCYVQEQGSDYRFVNEKGSEADFRFGERGRLYVVGGDWDPDVTATVTSDRREIGRAHV